MPPHETTAFDDPAPVTRIALPLLRKVTTLIWLADGRRLAFTSDAVIDIDSGVWRYLPEVLAVSASGSTVLTEDRYGFYDIATGATRDLVLNKIIKVATFSEDELLAAGGYDELLLIN